MGGAAPGNKIKGKKGKQNSQRTPGGAGSKGTANPRKPVSNFIRQHTLSIRNIPAPVEEEFPGVVRQVEEILRQDVAKASGESKNALQDSTARLLGILKKVPPQAVNRVTNNGSWTSVRFKVANPCSPFVAELVEWSRFYNATGVNAGKGCSLYIKTDFCVETARLERLAEPLLLKEEIAEVRQETRVLEGKFDQEIKGISCKLDHISSFISNLHGGSLPPPPGTGTQASSQEGDDSKASPRGPGTGRPAPSTAALEQPTEGGHPARADSAPRRGRDKKRSRSHHRGEKRGLLQSGTVL